MAPKSFNCPNCGAPLDYDGSASTVRCPYCETSVIVPPELRPAPARAERTQISITLGEPEAAPRKSGAGLLLGIGVLVVALIIAAAAIVPSLVADQASSRIAGSINSITEIDTQSTQTPEPTETPEPTLTPTPGFAAQTLSFGLEGIGLGMFEDARYLAVDGNGVIYVADYQGGRIQAFDSTGKYQRQWNVGKDKTIIAGLAANHQGQVYAAFDGSIHQYDGATGKLLTTMTNPKGGEYGDIAVTPDGGLAAVWYEGRWGMITSLEGHREDLVFYDAKGKITKTVPSFISGQTDSLALDVLLGVDGKGNVYALSQDNSAVFVFTPAGKFVNRFGSAGDQPGQFKSPRTIAVDGKGRLFIGGSQTIQVFSTDGRALAEIPTDIFADMIAFDEQGQLWAVARTKVAKFVMTAP